MAPDGQFAVRATFGRGLVSAFTINLALAICAIPIANHWNARGGEEWSVGLVVGGALLTGVLGIVALFESRRRGWGLGVLVGAVLAPLMVGAVFIWYFAILHGS